MSGIIDYIRWRGDLSFKMSAVNEVDFAILSQIAMLDLGGMEGKLGECAKKYASLGKGRRGYVIPKIIGDMFSLLGQSARFSGLVLSDYAEEIDRETDIQFSALTADCAETKQRFVIFSGTDDTLVGWKENFKLSYKTPTMSELRSVDYLNSAAEGFNGKVYVFGHSKGGHLALYSALNCSKEADKRIEKVVNFDGPGFADRPKGKRYSNLMKKAVTILPETSVFGRLFYHGEEMKIVESDGLGLMQHDMFNWHAVGREFIAMPNFSPEGDGVYEGLCNILGELGREDREKFIEGLFGVFFASSCETVTDLAGSGKAVVRAYFKAEGETRKAINHALLLFIKDKSIRKCIIDSSKSFKQQQ